MRGKIKKTIENAWKIFCEYYDYNASKYSESPNHREEPENSHWICWNESDLMVQLGRFFYKELGKIDSNIEMHFDKYLTLANFRKYDFADKLPGLKNNLGRSPKPDLIITSEDSYGPFLICAEAKYFHCSVESMSWRNPQTAEGAIKKDLKTLLKIKELGIAKDVVFIIFDDYYYLNEPEKCKKILNLLEKHNKKIKILYHNSHAKLKGKNGGENGVNSILKKKLIEKIT